MIRAVLFDYGLVLSGPADAVQRKRMEDLVQADPESFGAAYWKFRDDYDRGASTGEGYWNAVADALGKRLDDAMLASLLDADTLHWSQPNEPMIAWAAALQRAGMKTGILSNLGDAMEVGLHVRLPWLTGFSHKTFSHRLGVAKPDETIYRHAIVGLNVSPGEILFIDDREENIVGARAVEMVAIQYTDHDEFVQRLNGESFPQGVPKLERS